MALPDYFKVALGTSVTWKDSGGDAVLTLSGLANAAGRMGASKDLGAGADSGWDEEYAVFLTVETGTAPAAGTTVELYFSSSADNTTWSGKVTGADAAYPATVANNKLQLGPPVSVLVATNDLNTILRQQPTIWRPPARYIAPVVVNLLGQAFRATTNHSVVIVPRRYLIQDAA
jgi:hypothetical protein